ncbi:MAG: hypothetical protein ACP5EN_05875 [Rhodovulum sp.]
MTLHDAKAWLWDNLGWYDTKVWLGTSLGWSNDLLHVTLGLVMFLAIAALLRRRRHGTLTAFAAVAVAQTLNEILDWRTFVYWKQPLDWAEVARDFALTLTLPAALLLVRKIRDFLRKRRRDTP